MIRIIDGVHSKVTDPSRVRSYFKYQRSSWYRGQEKVRDKYMITKGGQIFTGSALPLSQKYKYKITGLDLITKDKKYPAIKGIDFRNDQLELIERAVSIQRGVIKSPTGSGKTVIAGGVISQFINHKILFLCHSLSIVRQTVSKFKLYGFKRVQMIGGGQEKSLKGDIIVSTIQSFCKIPVEDYCSYFDLIIIDEAHHVRASDSQYGTVLQNMITYPRLGFTATLSDLRESQLVLEGLVGSVIGELTLDEGIEEGILSKPIIKLINVPDHLRLSSKGYHTIYDAGVVNNKRRNRLIIREAQSHLDQGRTVLIMIKELEHGKNLVEIFKALGIRGVQFVRGATDVQLRERIKRLFNNKKIKVVISSSVWREGIDIPTLDVIINASGGKSEIPTLQAIGRGLRKAKGKTKVIIVDFLDPYRYLAEHSIQRVQIYNREKWIKGGE